MFKSYAIDIFFVCGYSPNESLTMYLFAVAPMVSPDQFMEVMVGEDLVLSTALTGFNLPITNIVWTQNGLTVNSVRITTTTMNTSAPNGTATLTLSPVNAPSDGGTYIVTAINDAGSDSTVFTVNVTCKLNLIFNCLRLSNYVCFIAFGHFLNITMSIR